MTIQILGQKSGSFVEVETNTLARRAIVRAQDVLSDWGGAYSCSFLASNATLAGYLYNVGPGLVIIRKLLLSAGTTVAATATNYSASVTYARQAKGIPVTNANFFKPSKLRSSMPESTAMLLAVALAQNQTNDAQPLLEWAGSIPAVTGSVGSAPFDLLDFMEDRHPLIVYPFDALILAAFGASTTSIMTFVWEERNTF